MPKVTQGRNLQIINFYAFFQEHISKPNIEACTPTPAPPSRFFPSLTHLISPSFLQLQQRLRPFLETLGHVDSEYTLKIDF